MLVDLSKMQTPKAASGNAGASLAAEQSTPLENKKNPLMKIINGFLGEE